MVKAGALALGTIVTNTWGYDQTNVDFYEVVKATAQFVTLRELKSHTTPYDKQAMAGTIIPEIDAEDRYRSTETTKHKVTNHEQYGVLINFKHGGGRVWDGTPQRCSWYA